jgi:hypothetical protein
MQLKAGFICKKTIGEVYPLPTTTGSYVQFK